MSFSLIMKSNCNSSDEKQTKGDESDQNSNLEPKAPATSIESSAKSTNSTKKSHKSRRPIVPCVPKKIKKAQKTIEIIGPSLTNATSQDVINPMPSTIPSHAMSTEPTNNASQMCFFTSALTPAMCFATPPANRIPSAIEEIFKMANDQNGPVRTLNASLDDRKFHVKVMWGGLPPQTTVVGVRRRLAHRKPHSSAATTAESSSSSEEDPFANWERFK
jgi:hypothetical protein